MNVHETPSPAKRRIGIVEDMPEVRAHWERVIRTFPEVAGVLACASAEEALREFAHYAPDVVLMDIFLPKLSGIECTAQLKQLLPGTRVLVLTASSDEDLIFPALEAGADGYLLKHCTPEVLRQGLIEVLQGGVPMTSGIARRVAEFFRRRPRAGDPGWRLSQRETEVLELLSQGFGNKEIAHRLNLSVETIRSYLKTLYDKMHVHSRAEAVAHYLTGAPPRPPQLRV